MFKKLVLIAVVLTALLVTATPVFAETNFCDPPPTQGKPRTTLILTCYFDTSYTGTVEMGTKDQPFKDINKAIAAAQAHNKGGYVFDKQTGNSRYYQHVISPTTGAPMSNTLLVVLLGLACLILVTSGWFLMRRARTYPNRG